MGRKESNQTNINISQFSIQEMIFFDILISYSLIRGQRPR